MILARLVFILVAAALALLPALPAAADPSDTWPRGGELFDQWDICRTRAVGEDGFFQVTESGFRPIIGFESLGEYADVAYKLGEEFARKYRDRDQRAEQIFYFVRDKIRYTSDLDQFGLREFAQNADEVARDIQDRGSARGDCEDMAVLFAVMCQGAGLRSAIVLAPDHAAAAVHLPGYRKANRVFTVSGESGWVWAEATARNNHLGWMPEKLFGKPLAFYDMAAEKMSIPQATPGTEATIPSGGGGFGISPFYIIIGLMWLMPLLRRRRRRR